MSKFKNFFSDIYYGIYNLWQNPYKLERAVIPRFKWKDRDGVLQEYIFATFMGWARPDGEDGLFPQLEVIREMQKYALEYHLNFWNASEETFKFIERNGGIDRVNDYIKDRSDIYEKFAIIYNYLDRRSKMKSRSYSEAIEKLEKNFEEFIFENRGVLWT
jgi:hypothetical protein